MLRLVARRLALGLMTLVVVSVLVFAGTEILPGDVATSVLGQSATPEAVAAIRRSLQLDDPAILRYLRWLGDFVQGDLGTSLATGQPIVKQLAPRLLGTLWLAGLAALVAVPLAVGLGILAAMYEGRAVDRIVSLATLLAISVPEFFIGYLLIRIFAVDLGWLPSLSVILPGMDLGRRFLLTILPMTVLVVVVIAHMLRLTRAAVIGVLDSPFVEMAVLKGLSWWRVVIQHALPNVLGPIANIVALNLAYLVVGVVVVEVVFVYPGMGQLMVDAVGQRDVPVVQACALIFAGVYVLLNLAADVIGILVNPRHRHPR
jgi:peptide/nickel transport system permease protein